ncbi:aminomethyl-transferring glycine dehydrogenase subunit GcvPA [Candidatus Margulisiibacteriota bacterium]
MNFISNTPKDQKYLFETIGINNIAELFRDIPQNLILKNKLNLSESLSELELKEELTEIANKNKKTASFLGGGSYNHYIPAVVNAITSRSEFYTAYTPYQAEISQGTLHAIFEYQSMICDITGMDVTNASMYDGATALAEAMLLAVKVKRKNHVIVSKTVNPNYREVLKTYANANSIEIIEIGYEKGVTDLEQLALELSDSVAAVIIQMPNFFGCIEDLSKVKELIPDSLLISATTEALSWAVLKPFAEFGVDIVTAEAQSFGNPMSFGGPGLGVIAVTNKHMRQIPGRLVGQTVDTAGKRGFVLTLSAREQHIRRDKATSNICSNQALCALAATVYLATLGKNLGKLAELNNKLAVHLKNQLLTIPGIELVFNQPFFNEFVVKIEPKLINKIKNIDFGIALEKYYPELKYCYLVTCTEMNSIKEIEKLILTLTISS